jgi:peroxiredoxin Q/BCP
MHAALRIAFVVLLAGLMMPMAAAESLQAGAPAPHFALEDGEGRLRQLADWRGTWLVLYFYPRDDTPGCTVEARGFRDAIGKFAALKAAVVGVSVDSAKSHRAFAQEQGLPFPLLVDVGGVVARSYGSLTNLGILKFAKRHTFLIDPDGRIARIYRDVQPASHAAELLADLQTFARN